jgi:hypothetical protein
MHFLFLVAYLSVFNYVFLFHFNVLEQSPLMGPLLLFQMICVGETVTGQN